MKSITVFCGSRPGEHDDYLNDALRVTEELVKRGITLIYGGGNIGLMGAIANRALERGGKVIGVIPEILIEKELAHEQLTELHQVSNMMERKIKLTELADGFVVLPGGIGTLDELSEEMALNHIGHQNKPIALLNTRDYYNHLMTFLKHTHSEGFLPAHLYNHLIIERHPETLVDKIISRGLSFSPRN
ncbi:TIGR00730 family Rossman fold protein [Endozoicomonas arenosclerae]|uniref:LOG family protein n=1 Tax=Endozoicomonas arenosclerae TaxID=1633495 RepID=UPI0007860B08|nr:TIGR00730 family Rossman fold protein [Endozoicomonas arenosclerae]